MKRRIYISYLVLIQLLTVFIANAQPGKKTDRILFVLDGSQAMSESFQPGTENRFQVASEIINSVIDSINQNNGEVEFGLRVFGHQFGKSLNKCEDTRMEVAYSKDNAAQVALRLNDLQPKGTGGGAYAITKALLVDLADTVRYRYSVVLLQGDNSCTEDNCSALMNSGKKDKLYRLYKADLGKDASADRYCMDNIFEIKDKATMQACINHIAAQFRVRKPVATAAARPVARKPKEAGYPVVKTKPIEEKPAAVIDTIVSAKPKRKEETVVLKPGSKIRSEDPSKFGQINLLNIAMVKQMKIYSTNNGIEKEVQDIFPVGLDSKLVKLPVGQYALLYTYGYDQVYKKIFEVLPEQVLDIMFR